MRSSQLQGEAAQLGNTKQRPTYMMSVRNYISAAAAATSADQKKSTARSTRNVALSLRFFKMGHYRWDHTAVELL